MTLTFSDLSIVGILGLIVIAAVTIRGRMWNKVHVLRSVGQMTDQAIMEDALRNAMPQPAQQPAQPTMESKLAELTGCGVPADLRPRVRCGPCADYRFAVTKRQMGETNEH